MSATLRIYRTLKNFKKLTYDVLPLFLMLPLLIFLIPYNLFPNPPEGEYSIFSLNVIVHVVFLVISFFLSLIVPRYDRWIVRPIVSSSIRFRELALYWLIEPLAAIGICFLGFITSLIFKYWSPMIPYVFISYTLLLITILRLKFHFEIIDQRLTKLGGYLVERRDRKISK